MAVGNTITDSFADSIPTMIASARIVREFAGVMPHLVDRQRLDENTGTVGTEVSMAKLSAQAVTENTELDSPQQMEDTLFSITPTVIGVHTVITDRVALVDTHQVRGEDDHYCVAKHIREIPSESSNTSGMTYGGGSLWLAANGAATAWRSEKETDAGPGDGIVLEVDPATGETRSRHPVPGGGCHGIEYHPPPHPTPL